MEDSKITNLIGDKPLRCLYDKAAGKWWYSAVDICAILTDCDYETARNYWKDLKFRMRHRELFQLVGKTDRLKLPATNGKYFFTDVLDFRKIIYLIQVIPSTKAEPFRLWLAEVVSNNMSAEAMFIEAGSTANKQIEEYKQNVIEPYVRQVVTRERLV